MTHASTSFPGLLQAWLLSESLGTDYEFKIYKMVEEKNWVRIVFCFRKLILEWMKKKDGKREKHKDGRFYSSLLSLTQR